MTLKLYKNGGDVSAPSRKHKTDAGADLYAPEDAVIPANGFLRYSAGLGVQIPEGFVALIFPRSGMTAKGIGMELPPIDANYTGNIHAILTNHTNEDYQIKKGDRIGQLVVLPCLTPDFEFYASEAEEQVAKEAIENAGARGDNGFGSTGR